jgi:hypothetical protein
MKWFKHMTNASDDDKISIIEARHGLVGYAVFWKLVELCAANWDEISPPDFIFSRKLIQNKLGLKSKQTDNILSSFSELNLFQIEKGKFVIKIFAPKLVDIKKRYQKNDQAETKQRPSYKIQNKNKETEVEIEAKSASVIIYDFKDSGKITPDKIIDLFNSKFKGVGKMKPTPSFGLPRTVLDDFKTMLGFVEFQKIESWENYFELVSRSKFLTMQLTPTLAWLFKSENAFKVIGGQYQDSNKNEPDDEYKKEMAALAAKYAELEA